MAEAAKWYVVHTYSGYENKVKNTIETTVKSRHLEDVIHVVSIPLDRKFGKLPTQLDMLGCLNQGEISNENHSCTYSQGGG